MTILSIVIMFFIAALLGIMAVYSGYLAVRTSPVYELKKRLRDLAVSAPDRLPEDLRQEIISEMSPLDRFLFGFGPVRRLGLALDNAGIKIDIKIFMLLIPVFAAAGYAIGLISGRGHIVAALCALVLAPSPFIYLEVGRNRRLNKFIEQFPDALDMISRSLKAGHSFSAAIQVVGTELPEPVAGLFKTAYDEQSLGLPFQEALLHMTQRIRSADLKFFVTAVSISRDIGGNLSAVLESLAQTIRERIKIRRQVRVYTAQARLSGYILAVVPIVMAVFFFFSTPGYLEELANNPAGRYAIGFAILAQLAGFLVIRKIINIKI